MTKDTGDHVDRVGGDNDRDDRHDDSGFEHDAEILSVDPVSTWNGTTKSVMRNVIAKNPSADETGDRTLRGSNKRTSVSRSRRTRIHSGERTIYETGRTNHRGGSTIGQSPRTTIDGGIKNVPRWKNKRETVFHKQTSEIQGAGKMCTLRIVADYSFFKAVGKNDSTKTVNYIIGDLYLSI